jgi:hypothetical protein
MLDKVYMVDGVDNVDIVDIVDLGYILIGSNWLLVSM